MTDLSHYRIDEAGWLHGCRVAVMHELRHSGRISTPISTRDVSEGLYVASEDAAAFIADTAEQARSV